MELPPVKSPELVGPGAPAPCAGEEQRRGRATECDSPCVCVCARPALWCVSPTRFPAALPALPSQPRVSAQSTVLTFPQEDSQYWALGRRFPAGRHGPGLGVAL